MTGGRRAYEALTSAGQARRMRVLARTALSKYGLIDAPITLIAHWENTTFLVEHGPRRGRAAPYAPGRYLLRLHRPGNHSEGAIRSELSWLLALRESSGVVAPEPVRALDGALTVTVGAPGVPGERVCSLLRWLPGGPPKTPDLTHAAGIGDLLARLHDHADGWTRPADFERITWDEDRLVGADGARDAAWARLPSGARRTCESAARIVRETMRGLGRGGGAFGLLHADLHLRNVVVLGGALAPIDFDDAGFGYRVFDFCPLLGQRSDLPEYDAWRDTMLNSYSKRRRLPAGLREHLDVFVAARRIHIVLWMAESAAVHSGLRDELRTYLPRVLRFLEARLGAAG